MPLLSLWPYPLHRRLRAPLPPTPRLQHPCTRHPLARRCEDGLRHNQNLEAKMRATSRRVIYCGLLAGLFLLPFLTSSAQTFSVIHDINCTTDGCLEQQPIPLTQGWDGNLYGQMYSGGKDNDGTIWKVTPTERSASLLTSLTRVRTTRTAAWRSRWTEISTE